MEDQVLKFYIFGENNTTNLYSTPDTNDNELLKDIAEKCRDKLQMTVYRKDHLIYYVYVERLSNREDYLGIGFMVDNHYCTDNKKLFDFLTKTVKDEIEAKGMILKSDSIGEITFATHDFSKNKTETDKLETLLRDKIRTSFSSDFSEKNNSFKEGNYIQKFVDITVNTESEFINDFIRRYNFVTIRPEPEKPPKSLGFRLFWPPNIVQVVMTLKKIRNLKTGLYWRFLTLVLIPVLMYWMLYKISGKHITIHLIACLLVFGLGCFVYIIRVLNNTKIR